MRDSCHGAAEHTIVLSRPLLDHTSHHTLRREGSHQSPPCVSDVMPAVDKKQPRRASPPLRPCAFKHAALRRWPAGCAPRHHRQSGFASASAPSREGAVRGQARCAVPADGERMVARALSQVAAVRPSLMFQARCAVPAASGLRPVASLCTDTVAPPAAGFTACGLGMALSRLQRLGIVFCKNSF